MWDYVKALLPDVAKVLVLFGIVSLTDMQTGMHTVAALEDGGKVALMLTGVMLGVPIVTQGTSNAVSSFVDKHGPGNVPAK